jgi:predicted DNA-binding protein (UPF0278 family)
MEWKTAFEEEMTRGQQARAAGNEGQARVCARRAAGIALRTYWQRQGETRLPPSAYALLNRFLERDDLPPEIRRAAVLLTMRVNEAFRLPVEADLLAEARRLAAWLLPEEEGQ